MQTRIPESFATQKNKTKRLSFQRVWWIVFGLICLIPYLIGIYLMIQNNTNMNQTIVAIFGLTLSLVLMGTFMVRAFSSRLRYVAKMIAMNVQIGSEDKLEFKDSDVEEVYMLARDFNQMVDELKRHRQHSKENTARMLSYINDLGLYEKKYRDEAILRANLSRYVGEDVVDELIRSERSFENVECTATVLFADIRNFTTLSENLEPKETIAMLNDYFEAMVPVVFKYGGTLDKFVGDELMAVFRDNPYGERAPIRAIRTGMEMIDTIRQMNLQAAQNRSQIAIGIGINTGKVVIGNVGSENRKDYTAIGDTVNVAARFEQIASGQEIIVGKETYEACKDQIQMQPIGEMILKNRKSPVQPYKILSMDGL